MEDHVRIFEVGARDGLQNEKTPVPAAIKIELINLLSETGLDRIEVTSFVSPKWVPQMADAHEVLSGINRRDGIRYAALTPNLRGYEGARAANADEVAVFASASEGFSQKNINCSIEESLERFRPVLDKAKVDGIDVRAYVSCICVCPYDGDVAPASVARVTGALLEMGCYEVSLGDTVGRATPDSITAMLEETLRVADASQLAGHYHDTGNQALENIRASVNLGLRTFDSSLGGLGGCPYAPGAKGNVSTGAVVDMLRDMGLKTGIDDNKLEQARVFIQDYLEQHNLGTG